jgi:hypothetical protein
VTIYSPTLVPILRAKTEWLLVACHWAPPLKMEFRLDLAQFPLLVVVSAIAGPAPTSTLARWLEKRDIDSLRLSDDRRDALVTRSAAKSCRRVRSPRAVHHA